LWFYIQIIGVLFKDHLLSSCTWYNEL